MQLHFLFRARNGNINGLVYLGFLLLCVGCSDLDNLDIDVTPKPLTDPIVLHLEEDPRFPVVLASVNGEKGFRFVLDTGATLTGLFMHDKAHSLELDGTANVFGPGGSGDGDKPETKTIKGVDIGFGELKLQNMAVLAFPGSVSDKLALGKQYPIDGIIGYDLFSRYMVTFDTKARTVTLSEPGTYRPKKASEILPLTVNGATALSGGRTSFIDMMLAQEEGTPFNANLHLDTGSSFLISLIPGSHSTIKMPSHAWPGSSKGIQGKAKLVWRADTEALIVGERLRNIQTVLAPKGKSTKGNHGRIGHGLLKRFRYTVDYSGEQLILEPYADSFRPYPTGYTGISAYPHKLGMTVTSIKPLSPAEEGGMKPGIYTHVNGQAVIEYSKAKLDRLLGVEAGEVLNICRKDQCYRVQAADIKKPPLVR